MTDQRPASFFEVGLKRLVDIGAFPADQATALVEAFREHSASGRARMLQPVVGELIAVKR